MVEVVNFRFIIANIDGLSTVQVSVVINAWYFYNDVQKALNGNHVTASDLYEH